MFSFKKYDCIGFDLDCTLAEYNLNELTELVYNLLTNFLVEKKNYKAECLRKPLHDDKYLMQKGLFLDIKRGNILKLDKNGRIIKATHGTCILKEENIIEQYGEEKSFNATQQFIVNPLSILKPPLENILRTTLDCFDMPCIVLFARLVDFTDKISCQEASIQYNFWQDVIEGLYYIYGYKNFELEGGFYNELKKNPSKYYKKWKSEKLDWLANLKKEKFLFLLTGSFVEFAECTAKYCIGENWRDYFDIVLYSARKPYFFIENRPFKKIQNGNNVALNKDEALKLKETYSQGNWKDLSSFLFSSTNICNPKCLYIGDNLIQDIFSPVKFCSCDTVAIVVEQRIESDEPNSLWGPFIETEKKNVSFWSHLVETCSEICVPSLDVFVDFTSLDCKK